MSEMNSFDEGRKPTSEELQAALDALYEKARQSVTGFGVAEASLGLERMALSNKLLEGIQKEHLKDLSKIREELYSNELLERLQKLSDRFKIRANPYDWKLIPIDLNLANLSTNYRNGTTEDSMNAYGKNVHLERNDTLPQCSSGMRVVGTTGQIDRMLGGEADLSEKVTCKYLGHRGKLNAPEVHCTESHGQIGGQDDDNPVEFVKAVNIGGGSYVTVSGDVEAEKIGSELDSKVDVDGRVNVTVDCVNVKVTGNIGIGSRVYAQDIEAKNLFGNGFGCNIKTGIVGKQAVALATEKLTAKVGIYGIATAKFIETPVIGVNADVMGEEKVIVTDFFGTVVEVDVLVLLGEAYLTKITDEKGYLADSDPGNLNVEPQQKPTRIVAATAKEVRKANFRGINGDVTIGVLHDIFTDELVWQEKFKVENPEPSARVTKKVVLAEESLGQEDLSGCQFEIRQLSDGEYADGTKFEAGDIVAVISISGTNDKNYRMVIEGRVVKIVKE